MYNKMLREQKRERTEGRGGRKREEGGGREGAAASDWNKSPEASVEEAGCEGW